MRNFVVPPGLASAVTALPAERRRGRLAESWPATGRRRAGARTVVFRSRSPYFGRPLTVSSNGTTGAYEVRGTPASSVLVPRTAFDISSSTAGLRHEDGLGLRRLRARRQRPARRFRHGRRGLPGHRRSRRAGEPCRLHSRFRSEPHPHRRDVESLRHHRRRRPRPIRPAAARPFHLDRPHAERARARRARDGGGRPEGDRARGLRRSGCGRRHAAHRGRPTGAAARSRSTCPGASREPRTRTLPRATTVWPTCRSASYTVEANDAFRSGAVVAAPATVSGNALGGRLPVPARGPRQRHGEGRQSDGCARPDGARPLEVGRPRPRLRLHRLHERASARSRLPSWPVPSSGCGPSTRRTRRPSARARSRRIAEGQTVDVTVVVPGVGTVAGTLRSRDGVPQPATRSRPSPPPHRATPCLRYRGRHAELHHRERSGRLPAPERYVRHRLRLLPLLREGRGGRQRAVAWSDREPGRPLPIGLDQRPSAVATSGPSRRPRVKRSG